jgi:hypothetical protein
MRQQITEALERAQKSIDRHREKCRKDNAQNLIKRQLSDHKKQKPSIPGPGETHIVFRAAKKALKVRDTFPMEPVWCIS